MNTEDKGGEVRGSERGGKRQGRFINLLHTELI